MKARLSIARRGPAGFRTDALSESSSPGCVTAMVAGPPYAVTCQAAFVAGKAWLAHGGGSGC